MRARDEHGRPTFPVLHERDEHGRPLPFPHGALPSMHAFRRTVASRALLAGESVDEVAFLLGHKDANVMRAVYVREVGDARRRAVRRSRTRAEHRSVLEPTEPNPPAEASRISDAVARLARTQVVADT